MVKHKYGLQKHLQVYLLRNPVFISEPSSSHFPDRMSIIRFANCDISCKGSILVLTSSRALITVFEVSDDKARSSKSSNSSSEMTPVCRKRRVKHNAQKEKMKTIAKTYTYRTKQDTYKLVD